jgi:dihydroorotate dehydrogenase (NAD+) catalytic subunit
MSWPDLNLDLNGLELATPLIAASGVWPLSPKLWPRESLSGLGAVCSKGLTLEPRSGNPGVRLWETPSGLLNSIGLQNPGLENFIDQDLTQLAQAGLPIIINLAPESEGEIGRMLTLLAGRADRIGAVELNLSCPNVSRGGMAWGISPRGVTRAASLARAAWPGRLWIKLTPQAPDMAESARAAAEAGADAVVVANTWLGMAMDLERARPAFDRVLAGLSGPAIFPLALRLVWEASEEVEVPVVASGGVCSWEDAAAMILAGASAVEVGTGLLNDLILPEKICRGLDGYIKKLKYNSISELKGKARPHDKE